MKEPETFEEAVNNLVEAFQDLKNTIDTEFKITDRLDQLVKCLEDLIK